MKDSNHIDGMKCFCLACLLIMSGIVLGCHEKAPGGTNTSNGEPMAVITDLTSSSTCSAAIGHIWVTITKVTAHQSSVAEPTDPGWVTLVDLTNNPLQVDLLSQSSASCSLANLGSATGIPAGGYRQVRLYLLDNTSVSGPTVNNCGVANGFNCVQLRFGIIQELQLSKNIQDGVVIYPDEPDGGAITLNAKEENVEVNISFDACASVILQADGLYRLKPALHIGRVAANRNYIAGTVVDRETKSLIPGAVILLERPDSNDIDRVVQAGISQEDGTFFFCPLPDGNYDVVVAAAPAASATTVYSATIAFHVPVGTLLGNIPLVSEGGGTGPNIPWATLAGQVTTVGLGEVALAADVTLSVLQDATPAGPRFAAGEPGNPRTPERRPTGGTPVHVTVPIFSSLSQPLTLTTISGQLAGSPCSFNESCFHYSLTVPSGNPSIGTYSKKSITYAPPLEGNAIYTVDAVSADCAPPHPEPADVKAVAVSPATTTQVSTTISFSNCLKPF